MLDCHSEGNSSYPHARLSVAGSWPSTVTEHPNQCEVANRLILLKCLELLKQTLADPDWPFECAIKVNQLKATLLVVGSNIEIRMCFSSLCLLADFHLPDVSRQGEQSNSDVLDGDLLLSSVLVLESMLNAVEFCIS